MNDATIRRLNSLNQRFYTQNATTFSATRSYAWPSWNTYWEKSAFSSQSSASVLDIGCGNGRLADFIREQLPEGAHWRYEGWDSAPALWSVSDTSSPSMIIAHFHEEDLVETLLTRRLWPTEQKYEIVALFGVLHHIPSQELRRQLIQRISNELLAEHGELWITLWDPARYHLKTPAVKIHPEFSSQELEEGDLFLGWKDSAAYRYVHFISPEEESAIFQPLQFSKVEAWDTVERGERGNRCLLLTK